MSETTGFVIEKFMSENNHINYMKKVLKSFGG